MYQHELFHTLNILIRNTVQIIVYVGVLMQSPVLITCLLGTAVKQEKISGRMVSNFIPVRLPLSTLTGRLIHVYVFKL